MESQPMICDNFSATIGKRAEKNSRFFLGVELFVGSSIHTGCESFGSEEIYLFHITCCSDTKSTSRNWVYAVPNSMDRELLVSWINELKPIFPTLNIQIYQDRINPNYMFSGAMIHNMSTIPLLINNLGKNYYAFQSCMTNGIAPCRIDNKILNYFIEFITDKSVYDIKFTTDKISNLVEEFVTSKEEQIFNLLETGVINLYLNRQYNSITIDPKYLNFEELKSKPSILIEYISKFATHYVNSSLISDIVKNLEGYLSKDKKLSFIKADYSKRKYPVESYLCHHLIRALFSEETIPFIRQYFRIKEKTPDMYFWNRIFLTQFGFRFFYYYWLTDQRFFPMVSEKDFNSKAFSYGGHSSLDFFNSFFKKDFPRSVRFYLKRLYMNEDFDSLISNMSINKSVIPKEKFRAKSDNFILRQTYPVLFESPECYLVAGDNYVKRMYKKSNFDEV